MEDRPDHREDQGAAEQADRMEERAGRMEDRSGELERQVEDVRRERESRKHNDAVPGAQPDFAPEETGDEAAPDRPERSQHADE